MTTVVNVILAAIWAGIAGIVTTLTGSVGLAVSHDRIWALVTVTGLVAWLTALTVGCCAAALLYLSEPATPAERYSR